ncbi:hypothetical protein [Sinorhizobium fredii]|uniref:hypothetical protein n=1 Tax=Rhizobium fredii TaxID=380 RepID=UPI0035119B73
MIHRLCVKGHAINVLTRWDNPKLLWFIVNNCIPLAVTHFERDLYVKTPGWFRCLLYSFNQFCEFHLFTRYGRFSAAFGGACARIDTYNLTGKQPFAGRLPCPLRHKVGSDIDECFRRRQQHPGKKSVEASIRELLAVVSADALP